MEHFQHWAELILGAIGSFIAAIAGVAMRHAHKAQRGEPFSWSRIWLDGPTVFVMGLCGGAVGEFLHTVYSMPELFGGVIAASLGYLGPSIVDRALEFVERKMGDGK
jgi:hypothetical protein